MGCVLGWCRTHVTLGFPGTRGLVSMCHEVWVVNRVELIYNRNHLSMSALSYDGHFPKGCGMLPTI